MIPVLTLIVLRCSDVERSASFYRALRLQLNTEQHGSGPAHYACVLGSTVLELYPAKGGRNRSVRLGFTVSDPLGAAERALSKGGLSTGTALSEDRAVVADPDGNTIELTIAPAHASKEIVARESPTSDSSDPHSPATKARLAQSVAEARGKLDEALEGRRWPAREFLRLGEAVRAYTKRCVGDELIHRAAASSVSGLRGYLEIRAGRVPANALVEVDLLETLLFSDYDPHFEGHEPPDL
jgi:catechol 2,3-dioxygenase-like lactoylglutathione lyase family enzyme